MAIIINGRQEGLGMKEIKGRPLPLGVTILEDEVNFFRGCAGGKGMPAIAVPDRRERALRGLSDGYGCRGSALSCS